MPAFNRPAGDWFAAELADLRRQITALGSVPGLPTTANYTTFSDVITSTVPAPAPTHPGPIVQCTVGSQGVAIVTLTVYFGITGIAGAQSACFADLFVDGTQFFGEFIYASVSSPAGNPVGLAYNLSARTVVPNLSANILHTFEVRYHVTPGGPGATVYSRFLEVEIPTANYVLSVD
jgi:hypothetical protein